MIRLRYFGRNKSLTQGTPQDASVKCPTRLRNSQKRSKNPWRLRECAMEEPSINELHEPSILLREGRDWGLFHPSETKSSWKGGKICRRRTGNLEFLQRRRKGLQAYRFLQRGRKFFFPKKPVSDGKSDKVTKTKWTKGEILPYHHRKCHPEKMMADQELNSRDGRNALTCPDNFIIPYPSPCGLLLQHRADKGQY